MRCCLNRTLCALKGVSRREQQKPKTQMTVSFFSFGTNPRQWLWLATVFREYLHAAATKCCSVLTYQNTDLTFVTIFEAEYNHLLEASSSKWFALNAKWLDLSIKGSLLRVAWKSSGRWRNESWNRMFVSSQHAFVLRGALYDSCELRNDQKGETGDGGSKNKEG